MDRLGAGFCTGVQLDSTIGCEASQDVRSSWWYLCRLQAHHGRRPGGLRKRSRRRRNWRSCVSGRRKRATWTGPWFFRAAIDVRTHLWYTCQQPTQEPQPNLNVLASLSPQGGSPVEEGRTTSKHRAAGMSLGVIPAGPAAFACVGGQRTCTGGSEGHGLETALHRMGRSWLHLASAQASPAGPGRAGWGVHGCQPVFAEGSASVERGFPAGGWPRCTARAGGWAARRGPEE